MFRAFLRGQWRKFPTAQEILDQLCGYSMVSRERDQREIDALLLGKPWRVIDGYEHYGGRCIQTYPATVIIYTVYVLWFSFVTIWY